jgi:hypothetical protein
MRESELLGGEDEREEDDREPISCNKINHALRSLANQPNHLKWLKTVNLGEKQAILTVKEQNTVN